MPNTLLQGPGIVYVFTLATLLWSLVLVGSMRTRVGRMEHRALSLKVVLAGFQYMGRSPLLLGAASLDLFAVLLGGPLRSPLSLPATSSTPARAGWACCGPLPRRVR